MKKTVLNYFCIKLLLLCFASMLIAAPTPAVGPLDVEGKVLRAEWSPKKLVQGIPGMSGTMGIDRIIPAHFRVTTEVLAFDCTVRISGNNIYPRGQQGPR